MTGRVYLIGAGPGDPGLLTLRGAELLSRADVVLYDGLSNDALLDHAARAEKICVGKHGQSRIWQQHEICDEILRHARAGRIVARLKGGDPAVFARTAEEIDAIRGAGIPFEVVPGITAALAAGSYAGIPITHRQLASAVALITGHEEPGKQESAIDWPALARFPGTLVVYMGVTTVKEWTTALIEAGKPADTPAAIIRRCSHPDQVTIHCRLEDVAAQLTPATRLRPPVIVIVGPVCDLGPTMSWFDQRPLFGQTVLVTRPRDQAEELVAPLRDLGASVLIHPVIEIAPVRDTQTLDDRIKHLANYGTLVFSSTNGVDCFFKRLFELGYDVRQLAGLRIAAVGSKTREAIESFHIHCDLTPERFDADSLAQALIQSHAVDPGRGPCLLVQASRGSDTLEQQLTAAAIPVHTVIAYEHSDVNQVDPDIAARLRDGKIDWVTLTSSQSARNYVKLFADVAANVRIATLSPLTSATVRELGLNVDAEADPYTMQALAEAMSRTVAEANSHA